MFELIDSKIERRGSSQWDDKLVFATKNIFVEPSAGPGWRSRRSGVQVRFSIPAGGRGDTTIVQEFGPKDYGALAKAMVLSDDRAALKAFATAIALLADEKEV
ncbi:hypothetical protein HJA90_10495 [Rhizobium bangladeshense]|uniref:hypothetical protein n=1 Tax=Rhizobium bangladeshense TaxID=1138189 RepID=UPI001C83BE1E|nr:hypothetical protein [Rhizobium bangladeshense]MBX4884011.1 hypothetical protein [Rhizobium bangladeshense]